MEETVRLLDAVESTGRVQHCSEPRHAVVRQWKPYQRRVYTTGWKVRKIHHARSKYALVPYKDVGVDREG